MTNLSRSILIRSFAFCVLILVSSWLFVLIITGKLAGPNERQAFEEIFGREVPNSVSDIRYEYFSHSRGHGYYLSFTADADDLSILFPMEESIPMLVDGAMLTDLWSAMDKFEEHHNDRLPDLKQAMIATKSSPGMRSELVLSPETNQLFAFHLVDADIN